jgi:predicted nucleic acid-binding protein
LCGYANIQKSLDAAPFSAAFSRSNCSTYDCEFVALAQANGARLLTVNRRILREFPEVAISLKKFVRD